MFTGKRGQSCKGDAVKKAAVKSLVNKGKVPGVAGKATGKKAHGASDLWVKRWGYGPASYLFDFFDPLFQKKAVKAFQEVYTNLKKISNKDTKKFKDPFDLKKMVSKKNLKKIGLKGVNSHYEKGLYEMSINTVQLNEAMAKWHWYIEPKETDYAVNFVTKYDFNGDGRLNIRELIVGTIMHNKNILGVENCKFCFQKLGEMMDAIFTFIDCNNDGLLSAEDLWNGLPSLNRPDKKYNIFKIKNSDNIRTNAINDFIIKNSSGMTGKITKEQFRTGILLGLWDRQTRQKSVIKGDSRNLKSLRWTQGGRVDTAAFNYIKEKELAKLVAKGKKKKSK